jgi:hypothetical protein
MAEFERPQDLVHNRGLIADPKAFARDADAASWLFLCGEEFAAMEEESRTRASRRRSRSRRTSSPIRLG